MIGLAVAVCICGLLLMLPLFVSVIINDVKLLMETIEKLRNEKRR